MGGGQPMLRVGLEVRTTAQESENSESARPERCIKKFSLLPFLLFMVTGLEEVKMGVLSS